MKNAFMALVGVCFVTLLLSPFVLLGLYVIGKSQHVDLLPNEERNLTNYVTFGEAISLEIVPYQTLKERELLFKTRSERYMQGK